MLIVVCDGVGGDVDSHIASEIVAGTFRLSFFKSPVIENFKKFYNEAIQLSCKYIDNVSTKFKHNEKMGTTINVVLIDGNKVQCANIGDTRTYRFLADDNLIQQISYDQNLQNFIRTKFSVLKDAAKKEGNVAKENELKQEEEALMKEHEDHLLALTCCLETKCAITPDNSSYNSFILQKDDQVIVCTDGVYNWIKPLEIIELIKTKKDYESCAGEVIFKAIQNQSNDNLTFVVAKYE
jgi:protein phosphatase